MIRFYNVFTKHAVFMKRLEVPLALLGAKS
jgi:hypothetical protein